MHRRDVLRLRFVAFAVMAVLAAMAFLPLSVSSAESEERGGLRAPQIGSTVTPPQPQVTNAPPIALAGPDQVVFRNTTILLSGSGNDPDGDPVTYSWSQVSGPGVSLTGNESAIASFIPTKVGAYEFQLTVQSNGSSWRDMGPITNFYGLETGDPQLAMNAGGDASIVFPYPDNPTAGEIWAKRYSRSVGWGKEAPIHNVSWEARDPQIALDSAGNTIAVWSQWDGANWSIYTNRHVPSMGWGTVDRVELSSGDAVTPQVAVDTGGNAVAVWTQWDGANWSICANRKLCLTKHFAF